MSPVEVVAILLYFASWSVLPLCLGIFMSNRNRAVNYSVYIALAAHVAMHAREGGPSLCIGVILMPFLAAVVSSIGALIRRGLIWAGWIKLPEPPPGPTCDHCGYCLRELTEPRCPECGHTFDPREKGLA